jgi:hypothetical protein
VVTRFRPRFAKTSPGPAAASGTPTSARPTDIASSRAAVAAASQRGSVIVEAASPAGAPVNRRTYMSSRSRVSALPSLT